MKAIKNRNLPDSLKLLCLPTVKWWSFRFLPVIVKNSFIWQIFLVLTNTNYLFLCLIYSKENWAVTNLVYIDIYYTMKRPVEHAILSFLAFSLFPKRLIFQVPLSQKKKFDLQTFHSKMFTWIFKKTRFVVYYFYIQEIWNFIFLISRICANDYCSIANWGYIN